MYLLINNYFSVTTFVIDLFGLVGFFSQCKPCDNTVENCFFQILSYPRTYRGIEWYKLRDPSFKIRDCQTQNHPKTRLETPTNISEISISGQNFPRPLFLEEPFYTPFICTAYFMKRQRVRTKFCSYTAVIHAVQNCHT